MFWSIDQINSHHQTLMLRGLTQRVIWMLRDRGSYLWIGFYTSEELQGNQSQGSSTAEAEGAKSIFQHSPSHRRLGYSKFLSGTFYQTQTFCFCPSIRMRRRFLSGDQLGFKLGKTTAASEEELVLSFDDSRWFSPSQHKVKALTFPSACGKQSRQSGSLM